MHPEYAASIDDAASVATSGRWDAVNNRLKRLAARPNSPDEFWYVELLMALCAQVFSEYLLMKRAYEEGDSRDVSALAWRARNLLELSVWTTYCATNRESARRFYEDAARDLNGVWTAFKKWGEATAQGEEWFAPGKGAQEQLLNWARADGIEGATARYTDVAAAAQEVGIGEHFRLFNKVLSKFAHPTAMQILSSPDEVLKSVQRAHFFSRGCVFFVGAFTALEGSIMNTEK